MTALIMLSFEVKVAIAVPIVIFGSALFVALKDKKRKRGK
jgi:hypothetical protein